MLGAKEELARKARQGVPPGRDGVGVRKAGAAKMRKRYGGASAELCTCGGAGTRESYSVFFCAWLIYQPYNRRRKSKLLVNLPFVKCELLVNVPFVKDHRPAPLFGKSPTKKQFNIFLCEA